MKFIYPAVFRKTENGTYHGFFPDLECCYAHGDTLDDAIDNANEAAYNWISLELSEDDCNLPSVSDKEDMELQGGDIVRNISVNIPVLRRLGRIIAPARTFLRKNKITYHFSFLIFVLSFDLK